MPVIGAKFTPKVKKSMNETAIVGIGCTSVGEQWQTSLRHLAWYAIEAALDDARTTKIEAMFVGNMLSGLVNNQRHLGALLADFSGLRGVESVVVESAESSGASAIRQAHLAVASGRINTALVVGVEKCSDTTGPEFATAVATSLDVDYEQVHGATLDVLAGVLMRRYCHEYGYELADFAPLSVAAHAQGAKNPLAMYRNKLKSEGYLNAPLIAEPINLFDAAPAGDGAAAVIVTRMDQSADYPHPPVRIAGSATATDTLAVHDRRDPLWFESVARSTRQALAQAQISLGQIDFAELHDAYTVMTALSLEAAGWAERGKGVRFAQSGALPISTFGGLKARGNPYGATGVYQIVEAVRQLRGSAEANQLPNPRWAMTQNIAGMGANAVTHILHI